jgi:hypothetical protein
VAGVSVCDRRDVVLSCDRQVWYASRRIGVVVDVFVCAGDWGAGRAVYFEELLAHIPADVLLLGFASQTV